MGTYWNSQQGEGKYALQFETDSKEKYKLVEKAAQMAVDGKTAADVVEVVRCKECIHWGGVAFGNICRRWSAPIAGMKNCTQPDDFCSCGVRKDAQRR